MITFKADLKLNKKPLLNEKTAIGLFLNEFLNEIKNKSQELLIENTNQISGYLLKSARVEIDPAGFSGELIYQANYAAFVEFGTVAHTPPLGRSLEHIVLRNGAIRITETPNPKTNPLDFWAWRLEERDGIKTKYGVHTALGFAVWLTIRKKGTQAHPFFRPAIDSVKSRKNEIASKFGLQFE